MKEVFESGAFAYVTMGLAGIGILLRMILGLLYLRLVKATEQMGQTKNHWARQLKARFEACYQLKIGVKNVDIFVDKYVYKQKFCGVLLSTWELISGQMKYICLIFASLGGIAGLVTDCGQKQIVSTFFVGIWMSVLLMIVDNISSLPEKRSLIALNLKDYLENFLQVRLEDPESYEEIQKEYAFVAEPETSDRKAKAVLKKADRLEKKCAKKELRLQKKEEKKRLAEKRRKEEEEQALAELAEKKLAEQKKKAAAMERRRQQLLKLQGEEAAFAQNRYSYEANTSEKGEEESAKTGKGAIIPLRSGEEAAAQTAATKEAEDKLIADVLKEFLS